MTMTVRFPPELEGGLRRYAAAAGVPASVVIREAVARYLVDPPTAPPSAHALGAGLFGRHAGPADLAETRKVALSNLGAEKQARRGG